MFCLHLPEPGLCDSNTVTLLYPGNGTKPLLQPLPQPNHQPHYDMHVERADRDADCAGCGSWLPYF